MQVAVSNKSEKKRVVEESRQETGADATDGEPTGQVGAPGLPPWLWIGGLVLLVAAVLALLLR